MSLIKYNGFEEIDREIIKVKGDMLRGEKVERRLDELIMKNQGFKSDEGKLWDILKKEEADVKRLEKVSFQSFLAGIMGNKDEKLSKEKQEFIKAKYDYDSILVKIESIEKEIKRYEEELKLIQGAAQRYDELIEIKKQMILERNEGNVGEILRISDEIANLEHVIREVNEAISAGEEAGRSIEDVLKYLYKAKDLGTWDLVGGGLIASMAKHSRLDDAKAAMEYTDRCLAKFNLELRDVQITGNFGIEISSFDKFADFMFDGLWADLNVQRKINDSIDSVEGLNKNVKDVIFKLDRELREMHNRINSKIDKLKVVVEKN